MKHVVVAVAILCAAAPPALAGDPLLEQLAGDWIGRGTYVRSPEADSETVYCRVSNALASGGTVLNQTGRCAVASNSAGMEITITALGAGQYSGHGNGIGLGSRGQANISGTGSGNRMEFAAELIDTASNRSENANATIDLAVDGYRLRILAPLASGGTHLVSEIIFTPH
jgi:hypothetical protein